MMARHGIPLTLVSDKASYYTSAEFKSFSTHYGFQHSTSSPFYPQSNGLAERGVGIVKQMLKKATEETSDPYLALLNYRATPLKGGMSPAELSMGRKLRTRLPDARELQDMMESKNDTPVAYNAHSKELPMLKEGDVVRIRDNVRGMWAQKAQVSEKHQNPRSYLVKTENGKLLRRNCRDLR